MKKATGKPLNKPLAKVFGNTSVNAVRSIVMNQVRENKVSPEERKRLESMATYDEVVNLLPEGWGRSVLGKVLDSLEGVVEPGAIADMAVLDNTVTEDGSSTAKVHLAFSDGTVALSKRNLAIARTGYLRTTEGTVSAVKAKKVLDYREEVLERASKLVRERVSTALEGIPGVEVITCNEAYADLKLSPIQ